METNSGQGAPQLAEALDKLRRLAAIRPAIITAVMTEMQARLSPHHHHGHHQSHDSTLVMQAADLDMITQRLGSVNPYEMPSESLSLLQQCRSLHPLIVEVVNGFDDGQTEDETEGESEKGLAALLPHPHLAHADVLSE